MKAIPLLQARHGQGALLQVGLGEVSLAELH